LVDRNTIVNSSRVLQQAAVQSISEICVYTIRGYKIILRVYILL